VGGIFEKLPSTAQGNELPVAGKIDQIAQAIDQYQKEIENLREQLTPTTPLAVKEQRKQEATMQLQEMEQQVSTTTELLDKAVQLWTRLEEDPQVQRWDKEEERINAMIQELKQRQKTIPIPERVKGMQEMKKMQAELITAQTQKQERQAQIEPLQEWVAEILAQAEGAKTQIAQTQTECAGLLSDEVAVQVVDTIKEKTAQALTKAAELKEKFQTITKEIEEAQKD
jgi:hypothetical protein